MRRKQNRNPLAFSDLLQINPPKRTDRQHNRFGIHSIKTIEMLINQLNHSMSVKDPLMLNRSTSADILQDATGKTQAVEDERVGEEGGEPDWLEGGRKPGVHDVVEAESSDVDGVGVVSGVEGVDWDATEDWG